MKRNAKTQERKPIGKGKDQRDRSRKPRSRSRRDERDDKYDGNNAKLEAEGRPNDPNYYFLNKDVANQVSQLSFQTLGGVPFYMEGQFVNMPNIKVHYWNPSPGVTVGGSNLAQTGINMAGLRIFTKLSAFTGRSAVYGPQDISTMILALGEVISVMEWCRRAFGVAFLGSESNRTYPRALLQAMRIDDVDFYPRYAEYRNRFNKIVTLVNQLPIPQNIAYFDKCAHMFEKIYLDAESPLATAIVDNISSTWLLDETSYSGGTILKTCTFTVNRQTGVPVSLQHFQYYLDWAETLVNALLNSSTLQIVYTDLLNLATKVETKFWKLDYLIDGYMVVPEYNPGYLLQMHNASIVGTPAKPTFDNTNYYTVENDVYPDANNNNLVYNPGFECPEYNGIQRTNSHLRSRIIDMLTPNPTVEDRIEVIRWCGLGTGTAVTDSGNNKQYEVDLVLADHYITTVSYLVAGVEKVRLIRDLIHAITRPVGSYEDFASCSSKVDWDTLYPAGTLPAGGTSIAFTGNMLGDFNFYTRIDDLWLRPIFNFTALALYELRA